MKLGVVASAMLVAVAAGCDWMVPIVTTHYENVAEARAQHVFGKGWLPDILPATTTDIVTSNNLDVSTSTGEFAMARGDVGTFIESLAPGRPTGVSPGVLDDVRERVGLGASVGHYVDGDTVWVFSCDAGTGECEYVMWLEG